MVYLVWEFPKIGDSNSTLNSRILIIRTPQFSETPVCLYRQAWVVQGHHS